MFYYSLIILCGITIASKIDWLMTSARAALPNIQCYRLQIIVFRRGADHHFELTRFHTVLHVNIVECKRLRFNIDGDGCSFSGFEPYFLKTFQLFNRPGYGSL